MSDRHLDPPYDEGDALGRVGFWIAVSMAIAGVAVLLGLWWLW